MEIIKHDYKVVFLYDKKIKNYENFLHFRENIQEAIKDFKSLQNPENEEENVLVVFFVNAYPINSYALGYLLKLKESDGINIKVYTNEKRLKNLFEMLELHSKFDIFLDEY